MTAGPVFDQHFSGDKGVAKAVVRRRIKTNLNYEGSSKKFHFNPTRFSLSVFQNHSFKCSMSQLVK